MISTVLQWDVIQKILFNTLFISLPEEIFWVMFILAFIGEYYFLEFDFTERRSFKARDIIQILSISGAIAITSNVLRYSGLGFTIIFPLSLVIMYASLVVVYKLWEGVNYLGYALLGMILGVLVIMLSEFLYMPFVLYGTGRTLEEINNSLILNFLTSLPSRVIQYTVLAFLITKVGTLLKANVIKPIINSVFLLSTTLSIVIFNTAFLFMMVEIICYEKILNNLSLLLQILIIVGIILLPVLNMLALLWNVYYVKNKEAEQNKDKSDKLKKLVEDIRTCTDTEKYDIIEEKLDYIEKVADELYLEKRED